MQLSSTVPPGLSPARCGRAPLIAPPSSVAALARVSNAQAGRPPFWASTCGGCEPPGAAVGASDPPWYPELPAGAWATPSSAAVSAWGAPVAPAVPDAPVDAVPTLPEEEHPVSAEPNNRAVASPITAPDPRPGRRGKDQRWFTALLRGTVSDRPSLPDPLPSSIRFAPIPRHDPVTAALSCRGPTPRRWPGGPP